MLQRYNVERRQTQAHPWFNIHCLRGRRRRHRRESDLYEPALILDWHHPHLLYITLATLFLCFADAHNTLQLLSDGAVEVNGFMYSLIHKSAILFIEVKLGLTAVCLIILVSYNHFTLLKRIRVRYVLYSVFSIYVGVIGYELAIWPGHGVPLILIPGDQGQNVTATGFISIR
jgi:small basic protein